MRREEMIAYLADLERKRPGLLAKIRAETVRVGPMTLASVLPMNVRQLMDEAVMVMQRADEAVAVIDDAMKVGK
jgi:hypothetical protein